MLTRAVDKAQGMVSFTIVRKKSGFANMYPKYYLYDSNYKTIFANAKKMSGNKTPNYLISSEEGKFIKDHPSFVGKLRGNTNKTKYLVFDNGENADRNTNIGLDQVRNELGYVFYSPKDAQDCATRNFSVAIPDLNENKYPLSFKQVKKEDSMVYKLNHDTKDNLLLFENKKPYWNEEKKANVLNFSDKVECSSVKNFQLVKKGESDGVDPDQEVYLEFGRIRSDRFTLSIKWPFSIMTAFSIALTAFDK